MAHQLVGLTGYERQAILDSIGVDMEALLPDVLDQVNVRMPTRDLDDARKVTQRTKKVAYVIDTPGVQPEGRTSAFGFQPCLGGFITDYAIGIVGVAPIGKSDDPQDIVTPIFEAIFEVLLRNSTRNDGTGALALDTIPISTNHTAREQAPRIAWNMLFVCPFEWSVD